MSKPQIINTSNWVENSLKIFPDLAPDQTTCIWRDYEAFTIDKCYRNCVTDGVKWEKTGRNISVLLVFGWADNRQSGVSGGYHFIIQDRNTRDIPEAFVGIIIHKWTLKEYMEEPALKDKEYSSDFWDYYSSEVKPHIEKMFRMHPKDKDYEIDRVLKVQAKEEIELSIRRSKTFGTRPSFGQKMF